MFGPGGRQEEPGASYGRARKFDVELAAYLFPLRSSHLPCVSSVLLLGHSGNYIFKIPLPRGLVLFRICLGPLERDRK